MTRWQNRSPGDLSVTLPVVEATPVAPALAAAASAAGAWGQTPLTERADRLRACRAGIEAARDDLARGIALETGKPIRECVGELGAVIAKFDLTIADADRYLRDESPGDAPHPSIIRRMPRGPAVVIGPFNFPIHLPHGQLVSYLIAGNPVIFKPSPVAANVCARYATIMAQHLPAGVFGLVQGGADEAQALCRDPRVRAVGFTGSVPAGKAIARACVDDLGKDLALELGGKCAAVICADADLHRAADMCAEAACLTAGQRCNATSRILVDQSVLSSFLELFLRSIHGYSPGDPLKDATRLGALANEAAHQRYGQVIQSAEGHWLKRGHVPASVEGMVGYYAEPAVVLLETRAAAERSTLWGQEMFVPIVTIVPVSGADEAVVLHNASPFGLTASVFTKSREQFMSLADRLHVGNVYANLPTTFSPSQLPFGGWRDSGNGRPGGRGFVRFTTDEQAVQMAKDGFAS